MRKLWSNFSWIVSGTAFATAIRALTLLLLVRWTSPQEFGFYAGVFGLLVFGKALSDVGLTKLIIRDRALNAASDTYGQALRLNTRTSVLLGVVGTLGIFSFAVLGPSVAWSLLPMAAAAAFEKNADTWRSVHLADGDAHLVALYTLARRIITLLVFIGLFFWSPVGAVLAMTLAELVAAFSSMMMVRWSVARVTQLPTKMDPREVFRASRPYWIHSLAMNVRNLDVSIVAFFAPVAESGYFAAATRLSGPLQLIPSSLASVLLPHSARADTSEGGRSGRIVLFATLSFIPLCLLLAWLMPRLAPVMLGQDYEAAILCIQIIILGLPLSVYSNLATAALQGMGFARAVSRASWAYAIVLLLAIALGAYLAGANGAAVGTVVANMFLAGLVMKVWTGRKKNRHAAFKG